MNFKFDVSENASNFILVNRILMSKRLHIPCNEINYLNDFLKLREKHRKQRSF